MPGSWPAGQGTELRGGLAGVLIARAAGLTVRSGGRWLAPGDRTGEAGDVRGGLEACLWWPDPATGLGCPPGGAAVIAADGRPGRPACGRDVRGNVRIPRDHGAQPESRGTDVRRRDDHVPSHR